MLKFHPFAQNFILVIAVTFSLAALSENAIILV